MVTPREIRHLAPLAPTARNPYESILLGMCFLSGLAFMVGCIPTPNSIATYLPPLQRVIWGLMLFAGGGMALAGSYMQRTSLNGARIEQTGVLSIGFGCFIYGVAVLCFAGDQATFPGLMTCGVGVASFIRYRQLHKALKQAEAILDELEAHVATMRPRAGD